jgi:hypothetical protein
MSNHISAEEVLALLFPERPQAGSQDPKVTAFVRDPQGGLMLATVAPSRSGGQGRRPLQQWHADPRPEHARSHRLRTVATGRRLT